MVESSFEIDIVELPTDVLDTIKAFLASQIIPDPSNELIGIYEKRVLIDLSYLKAEKYDSPEWTNELEQWKKDNPQEAQEGKIPLNKPNPNLAELLKIYEKIKDCKTVQETYEELKKLVIFLNQFDFCPKIDWSPVVYEPLYDVRFCDQLEDYLNYWLTKKYQQENDKQTK